jgi:DNA-binding transcriptional LysR family regulator
MPLNLTHLSAFSAVAETGSVTRGAERLMVSQPAVSKQVNELESALRVTLLERHGRGVRLTDAGRLLATYARSIFALADEAEVAMTDVRAMRLGRLAVGATPTIGTYLLPEVLVYFRQRFPGIRVDVETAETDLLRKRLAEDVALDVALGDELLVFPGMQRRPFMRVQFVAVAPTEHPLSKRRRVSLADLAAQPMVMRESGVAERSLVERHFAESNTSFTTTLTLGTTEAVKRAVRMGLGLAVLPRIAVEGEVSAGRLALLRVQGLALTRPLYEVWNSRRPRGKAAQAFHCVLEHAARGTLPSRPRKA